MRVAVTGALGALGGPLCRGLAAGHQVVGLDRGRGSQIRADVRHLPQLIRAFRGCDAVVHLATRPPYDWTNVRDVLIEGTYNALEAARHVGIRVFVLASRSGAVAPESFADVGSACAESLLSLYARLHGLKVHQIRIAEVSDTVTPGSGEGHFTHQQFLERVEQCLNAS